MDGSQEHSAEWEMPTSKVYTAWHLHNTLKVQNYKDRELSSCQSFWEMGRRGRNNYKEVAQQSLWWWDSSVSWLQKWLHLPTHMLKWKNYIHTIAGQIPDLGVVLQLLKMCPLGKAGWNIHRTFLYSLCNFYAKSLLQNKELKNSYQTCIVELGDSCYKQYTFKIVCLAHLGRLSPKNLLSKLYFTQ